MRLNRRNQDERGIAIVTTALLVTAMLIVAGLVLDGSQNYSVRREMQNAADSAAMAGTQALYKYQFQGGSASNVLTAAQAAAGRNGNNSSFTCTVVQSDGATPVAVSPADCSNTTAVASASAAGVAVKTKNTRNLAFGAFLGAKTQGVTATAAATVQPLAAAPAPFLVCGAGTSDTGNNLGGYDILKPGNPYPTVNLSQALSLYGNPTIYPTSVAPVAIQMNTVPDCGAHGGSFDGKGDGGDASIGQWVNGAPGNGSNNHVAYQQVISATPCPSAGPYSDCDIMLPIIDQAVGNGSNVQAHIVAWTVWHVTPGHGNTKFQGYLETALVSSGPTSTGLCTSGACVVKLRA